jgi:predicted RNA-binding Zn ribbon-like protein
VQLLVNSIDREHNREWLPEWLNEHGLPPGDFERARELREALRALLHVNNVGGEAPEAVARLNDAARDVRVELRADGVVLAAADPLGEVTAVALTAMIDGTWKRLKVCRNCEWSFYDTSKNRSGSWCSMQLCGNRLKTRAYRKRRRSAAS